MVAWGPIIGAGISALGSLFGGDDDEETTTTIDYRKMAREAERAGFNPLTAIRNGGSAGFTTTTHPGLSMADRFGQAFQTIGNALASFDARADERADLELRIQRAELERIQKANLGGQRMSFDVPHASGSTRSTSSARAGTGGAMNVTKNIGTFTPAPFEPVTEYDEVIAGVDQGLSDFRRLTEWQVERLTNWEKQVRDYLGGGPARSAPKFTQPRRPVSWTPGYNRHALGG